MLVHEGASTSYMQGSTDFLIVAHAVYEQSVLSQTVKLERILERPADSQLRRSGSTVASPQEKHDVRFGRTEWELEVRTNLLSPCSPCCLCLSHVHNLWGSSSLFSPMRCLHYLA